MFQYEQRYQKNTKYIGEMTCELAIGMGEE